MCDAIGHGDHITDPYVKANSLKLDSMLSPNSSESERRKMERRKVNKEEEEKT